jgi:hypothetical protein
VPPVYTRNLFFALMKASFLSDAELKFLEEKFGWATTNSPSLGIASASPITEGRLIDRTHNMQIVHPTCNRKATDLDLSRCKLYN